MDTHHDIAAARQRGQARAQQVAQAPTYAVADDGRPDRTGHDETDTYAGIPTIISAGRGDMHRQSARTRAHTVADGRGELGWPPHARDRRKHEGPCPENGQADSRSRPLRRRLARIARPARVRIRRRNPCVLARRRLFGWNVRLLTAKLHQKEGKARLRRPHTGGRSSLRSAGHTVKRAPSPGSHPAPRRGQADTPGDDHRLPTGCGEPLMAALRHC